ncbi:uncharacterized protein TRUGW13939_10903 [Talaromyces rugulosus]|uniref:G domain-containing protein n=1 Tax=Talaromyces rugulosus TaxID=121627 RepID=A0A7H8RBD0_TALRU|nr:uncharacterized protein TRUGW13939_10903 [Talaromyces rugulosus]QKX63732.1 hypothetical protein TRUGW13939_10903 [Talaromyces rugulosus]
MSLFARLHASIFGSSGPEAKIAIIGLAGVGKNTLLRLINEDQIQTICHPNSPYLYYKTGKNYHLRMNYVMTYVGYDEPGMSKIWLGEQFCDSDGIILVIDDDHDSKAEAAEWMEAYVKGFRRERWPDHFPDVKIREGIPWLILANTKKSDNKLTIGEVQRFMGLDELQIDYYVEVVNILTGEGVANALKWLRQRVDTPVENRLQMREVKSS